MSHPTDPSLSTLAAVVADGFADAYPRILNPEAVRDLAHRIETALRTAVRMERAACVEPCGARALLWSTTAERETTPALLRAEARSRANEAQYLVDALRARGG